ncbi:hypothetical protein F5Y09DRAFT_350909 [Xylaria sp. FL1042]|nr:hypothetical protein F5Y09DRAFT_350909 [Xylaria sp. FL1042]
MSWARRGICWRRPLNCDEIMYKSMAAAGRDLGREKSVLVGTVKIAFLPDMIHVEQRLRSTWAALRLRHLDVAVVLEDNEKCYQPIASDDDLEAWVISIFRVETAVRSANELLSRHIKCPMESASCHWPWDGRGHIMILHEFLSLLAAPGPATIIHDPGSEAAQLVPPLDAWSIRADTLVEPMIEGYPPIGLPADTGSLPGDTLRIETVIPYEITSALRAGCRARGIRLTAALHASLIVTTAQYNSWAAFDLRKCCPALFHGPLHTSSIRMIGLPLGPIYEQSFALEHSDLMFVRVPYMERMTRMVTATAATPPAEPVLSNLGTTLTLDDSVHMQYGDFTVQNVWLGVHTLIPQLVVHTWSWKGSLRISIFYNESFYEATLVEAWLEKFKVNLFANLDVESGLS